MRCRLGAPVRLPDAVRERLLQDYAAASDAWRASPGIASTVRRLERLGRLHQEAAMLLGDLTPQESAVLGLDLDAASDLARVAADLAERCTAGLLDLDRRGAGRGGDRRLAALFESTPRFRLALAARAAAVDAGHQRPSSRVLADLVAELLGEAGEEAVGVENLIRALPRLGANRSDQPPVMAYLRDKAGSRPAA
jgi:hypothetical protein